MLFSLEFLWLSLWPNVLCPLSGSSFFSLGVIHRSSVVEKVSMKILNASSRTLRRSSILIFFKIWLMYKCLANIPKVSVCFQQRWKVVSIRFFSYLLRWVLYETEKWSVMALANISKIISNLAKKSYVCCWRSVWASWSFNVAFIAYDYHGNEDTCSCFAPYSRDKVKLSTNGLFAIASL